MMDTPRQTSVYRHQGWAGEKTYEPEDFIEAMSPPLMMATLARRLPKSDLHYHFAGTLRPSRLHQALAAREGRRVTRLEANSAYDYVSWEKFFDDLDRVAALWTGPAAITESALDCLMSAYDLGVRHVEMMCVPDLHRPAGLTPVEFLKAVGEAFKVARDVLDMTGGIIIELNRHLGSEAAVDLVTETLDLRDSGVPIYGYGNSGDDWKEPFEAMEPAYALARREGYLLTGHANSLADVTVAIDLGLDRIDHGWFATESDLQFTRLVESGIGLTLCPSCRLYYGASRFTSAFERLREAGVPIAIGTDDPYLFFSDIAADYTGMATESNWSPRTMADLALSSLDMAWGEPAGREDRRREYVAEIEALLVDVCAPDRDRSMRALGVSESPERVSVTSPPIA